MKPTSYLAALLLLLYSCGSLSGDREGERLIPTLGALGKTNKNLISEDFLLLGNPTLEAPVPLSVRRQAFTKTSFKKFSERNRFYDGKRQLEYIDSLPKPTYLNLQISDRIELKSHLNTDENSDVRNYLSKDTDCRLVSGVSMVVDQSLSETLFNAEQLQLTTTKGQFAVRLVDGNSTKLIPIPDGSVFDYELSSFCWGKDQFGKFKIEAITPERQGCPRGTESKAHKLADTRSYLKL